MENASKALLIAGGVLIAMVIASFGVYLYGVFHSHSENLLAAMSEKEVNEFNAKFQAFENKKLTANEVVSIINLVRDNNMNNESLQIQLELNHIYNISSVSAITDFLALTNYINSSMNIYEKECNQFLHKYAVMNGDKYYFICNVIEYNDKNLVSKVKIEIRE